MFLRHSLRRATAPVPLRAFSAAPAVKPASPDFSSGPCKKRPGWSTDVYKSAALGRSHRSKLGKAKLKQAIDDTRRVLGVPDDYLIGIVPASDTGAFEMAMWSMLGERPVDACCECCAVLPLLLYRSAGASAPLAYCAPGCCRHRQLPVLQSRLTSRLPSSFCRLGIVWQRLVRRCHVASGAGGRDEA